MRHSFTIENIKVNPILRPDFDNTPNEDRTQKELNEYWNKPYIIIDTLHQEPFIEHVTRMNELGYYELETEEAFNLRQKESRDIFYSCFPDGFKYQVRCLDGGAWDRSTMKGNFNTFNEALEFARLQ